MEEKPLAPRTNVPECASPLALMQGPGRQTGLLWLPVVVCLHLETEIVPSEWIVTLAWPPMFLVT